MELPADLLYTHDHEWVRVDGDLAVVGITEYAAAALGDIVFVGLPRVGEALSAGQVCGEIESTKSVSELLNPIGGEVVEINEGLSDETGVINNDPYGAGWLFRLSFSGPIDLLDVAACAALTEEN